MMKPIISLNIDDLSWGLPSWLFLLMISKTYSQSSDATLHSLDNNAILSFQKPSLTLEQDVVITVLPEPKHVKDVFFGILSVGELPPCSDGERLFIDCSTIDPTSSCDVANAIHSTKSGRFVDAPMSGGIVGARAGSLTFMLGASDGTSHLVDHVKTVLHHMGKKVWHLGGQGAGLSGKLANNYLLAVSNIAAAEAMNLGIKWGLEPSLLADMINSSSGRCWASEVNNPVPGVLEQAPASKGYEGGFGIGLMKKDLRLAMEAASEAGAKLELADKAKEVYESAEEIFPKKDFAVVYEWLSVERNGNGK